MPEMHYNMTHRPVIETSLPMTVPNKKNKLSSKNLTRFKEKRSISIKSYEGWDLLPLTYRPNMKFITTPIMKIREAVQKVQIGIVWGA